MESSKLSSNVKEFLPGSALVALKQEWVNKVEELLPGETLVFEGLDPEVVFKQLHRDVRVAGKTAESYGDDEPRYWLPEEVAKRGHTSALKFLLDNNIISVPELYTTDIELHMAKYPETAKMLLGRKDFDTTYRMLALAATYGQLDLTKQLLQRGSEMIPVDPHDPDCGYALEWSIKSGNVDVVKAIVEDTKQYHGQIETAKETAIKLNMKNITEYLNIL